MNNPFVAEQDVRAAPYRFAVVTGITGEKALLKWEGEQSAGRKGYKWLLPYVPAVGDRVCTVRISGTYLIVGKVV